MFMQWNEERDVILLREMAARGIFQYKAGSRERGNSWQEIATSLNSYENFFVSHRAVRDRFMTIMKRFKAKTRKEVAATGLGGDEPTEYEILVEDLTERFEESDRKMEQDSEAKKSRVESEKNKALEMRQKAMERFGDTKKRKELEGSDSEPTEKKRRSSSDMINFLREKMEYDNEKEQHKMQENREIREAQERKHMEIMQQNQHLQTQQSQTLQLLAQQQQQLMQFLMEKKQT